MNKSYTTILLLCLTATALTAVVPDGECCADCLAPFAQEGTKRKGESGLPTVTTFTTPSTEFTAPAADADADALKESMCGQYWTENGGNTCCKQADLAKRADAMKKRINKRFHFMFHTSIKKGHGKYKKNMNEALETLKDETVQTTIINNSAADTDNENVTADDIAEAIKIMEDLVAKKPEESEGEEEEAAAKKNFKTCAKTYGDSQMSNMCFDCSTKVGSFYDDAANNLKISKEWCTKITTDCAGLFGVNAQNMALDRLLRIMNNYMDSDGTKMTLPKRGIKSEADYKMLGDCAADPAACAADDTKRAAFCGFMSLRDDNSAIFGDGEDGEVDPSKIKGRKPKSSSTEETTTPPATRRLLSKLPKFVRRMLEEVNYGFVTESTTGLNLQSIVSGVEFSESELPSDTDETTEESENRGKIVGSIAAILLLVGAQFM